MSRRFELSVRPLSTVSIQYKPRSEIISLTSSPRVVEFKCFVEGVVVCGLLATALGARRNVLCASPAKIYSNDRIMTSFKMTLGNIDLRDGRKSPLHI